MKRILLALAIIASITACTKPETPSPEPEENTTSKSYVGCMRSDYPDITISGVSVNDKIIYDIKTVCTYNSEYDSTAEARFYASELTLEEIEAGYAFPVVEINVSTKESENFTSIYIPAETFDDEEIRYSLHNGKVLEKSANIQSVDIKEATVIPGSKYFQPDDTCKFDIKITQKYGYRKTINIVYYGKSFRLFVMGDNPDMK